MRTRCFFVCVCFFFFFFNLTIPVDSWNLLKFFLDNWLNETLEFLFFTERMLIESRYILSQEIYSQVRSPFGYTQDLAKRGRWRMSMSILEE